MPHLEADGQYIWGKGIWVLAGNGITVEHIEFSGASVPDQNGAGIRLDGIGLTVRHCYFHHNENGILTGNPYEGEILIEYSEFDSNGYGDGYSHNLYIGHVDRLTFRFNYSHHAAIGHNLKSRADENFICYNRIMDEADGTSSRLIDLPNGGFSIVMGNLLMQGELATNNNLLGYGLEGLTNTLSELYVANNTFVNKRVASCIFISLQDGASVAQVTNNIFAGIGTLLVGTATTMDHNYDNASIGDLLFADEANYDYHLLAGSPTIDVGSPIDPVNGYSLVPDQSYLHPLSAEARPLYNGSIDAGAYEYLGPALPATSLEPVQWSVYPNPTHGPLRLDRSAGAFQRLRVWDAKGRVLPVVYDWSGVDLSSFGPGVYWLEIKMGDGRTAVETILVE